MCPKLPIEGDLGTTKAQWGVHKHYDVDPDFIDRYISKGVKHEDVDIIDEYISLDNALFLIIQHVYIDPTQTVQHPRTVLSSLQHLLTLVLRK